MMQRWLVAPLCLATACGTSEGRAALAVTNVVAPAPIVTGDPAAATMALYATIANEGMLDDTLVAVESDAAKAASIHETVRRGGMATMAPVARLVIPADSVTRLAPGGTHLMLDTLTRPITAGDTLRVVFVFAHGRRVGVTAAVVPYDQLEHALHPEASP